MKEPLIEAGIVSSREITIYFHGLFKDSSGRETVSGEKVFRIDDFPGSRTFTPDKPDSSWVEIKDVSIGKGFHWERTENQSFKGSIRIIKEGALLTAVNIIGIEEYLKSVISSEMSAGSPTESLRAHAVISRSWLISQLANKGKGSLSETDPGKSEYIRWFDHKEHENFDVCADDHCQRYQGITRIYTQEAEAAVEATRGMVLMSGGTVCDARYSKCCGGVSEDFENVWEPAPRPCLVSIRDSEVKKEIPDLTTEENARVWIESSPEAWCNTQDKQLLASILNDYDRETPHFYRWKVEYSQKELTELIERNTGFSFGEIDRLAPMERGRSGRIVRLKIIGAKKTMTIGKELVIRKTLSDTHLYSSAFVVDTFGSGSGKTFHLTGAGWGHGVGLCQIGAAVMGSKGYGFKEILSHYYSGSEVVKAY